MGKLNEVKNQNIDEEKMEKVIKEINIFEMLFVNMDEIVLNI